MAGRRPKPTALHLLHGTFNATKHGRDRTGEPVAEGELVAPPDDLTPEQKCVWRYAIKHAPKGVLKMIDRDILLVWVEARDRWNRARLMQSKIDASAELKLLIRGPQGLALSPYNEILEKTAKTMVRAAQDLVFSPAARPRLYVPPSKPPAGVDDPWRTLRLLPGGNSDREGA